MADVASVTTTLALLIEAEPRIGLEPEARTQLHAGIRSKIATAITNLQAVDVALSGEPKPAPTTLAPVATEPPPTAPVAPRTKQVPKAGVTYRAEWRKQRMRTMVRDNFVCQSPGCTSMDLGRLHVVHLKFKAEGGTDDLANLATLCEVHYNEFHKMLPEDRHACAALIGGLNDESV